MHIYMMNESECRRKFSNRKRQRVMTIKKDDFSKREKKENKNINETG